MTSVYNALPCKNVLECACEWNMMTATNSALRKFVGTLQEHEQESWVNSEYSVLCLLVLSMVDTLSDLGTSFFSLCTRRAVNCSTTGKKLWAF